RSRNNRGLSSAAQTYGDSTFDVNTLGSSRRVMSGLIDCIFFKNRQPIHQALAGKCSRPARIEATVKSKCRSPARKKGNTRIAATSDASLKKGSRFTLEPPAYFDRGKALSYTECF